MRHLALLIAIAACLIIFALIVDWRDFGWPDLILALVGDLVGVLLAYVIDPLVSKRTISACLWLENSMVSPNHWTTKWEK